MNAQDNFPDARADGDGAKNLVSRCVEKSLGIYDAAMRRLLSISWLRTYYRGTDELLDTALRSRLRLSPSQREAARATCVRTVVGAEEASRLARGLTRRHAFRAMVVTALCSLPQNWLMWPLFVVDIVFFQKEVFLMAQEQEMIYGVKNAHDFDYAVLASVAVKMEGTMLRHKLIGYAKRIVGKAARMAVEWGSAAFRGSLRTMLRQGVKWAGLMATREALDLTIDAVVVILTSVLAGLVSYSLMLPMGRRLRLKLESEAAREKLSARRGVRGL